MFILHLSKLQYPMTNIPYMEVSRHGHDRQMWRDKNASIAETHRNGLLRSLAKTFFLSSISREQINFFQFFLHQSVGMFHSYNLME